VTELVRVDAFRAEVEAASTVEELRELRAKAVALEKYLAQQAGPISEQAKRFAEERLRIERRIGEILAEVVRAGNPQLSDDTTIDRRLPNGITRDQSSRWWRRGLRRCRRVRTSMPQLRHPPSLRPPTYSTSVAPRSSAPARFSRTARASWWRRGLRRWRMERISGPANLPVQRSPTPPTC
jgi:hypothetical protein